MADMSKKNVPAVAVAVGEKKTPLQPALQLSDKETVDALAKLSKYQVLMKQDGACLFRAVSQLLYDTQDYHLEVRQKVCDYLLEHTATYWPFVQPLLKDGGVRDMPAYVEHMKKATTYGDEPEISTLFGVFNLGITIYYNIRGLPTNTQYYPVFIAGTNFPLPTIWLELLYKNDNHYDLLLNKGHKVKPPLASPLLYSDAAAMVPLKSMNKPKGAGPPPSSPVPEIKRTEEWPATKSTSADAPPRKLATRTPTASAWGKKPNIEQAPAVPSNVTTTLAASAKAPEPAAPAACTASASAASALEPSSVICEAVWYDDDGDGLWYEALALKLHDRGIYEVVFPKYERGQIYYIPFKNVRAPILPPLP